LKKNQIFFFLILFLFVVIDSSCTTDKLSIYRKSKSLIDTFVYITVVSDSEEKADIAIEHAFSSIERYGKLINFFSDESELYLINSNAGIQEVKVSSETIETIEKSIYIAEISGGAFDPTIGPVMKLWDFYKKTKPSKRDINKKLPLVNYRNIIINRRKSTVFLQVKGMLLDLGGISKGYAADLAVKTLKHSGIKSGLVAIAGDIKAFGLKPDGKPWMIGIQNPRQKIKTDEIIAKINLLDKAISTSGDYQRYFMINDKRYHHLLDPKTGYPVNKLRSVSIITDKGVLTDGFSTAVFILGPEKGLELVQKIGIDAIIIDNKGIIHSTSGLKGKLKIEGNH
jgi:thiamine biosynthesis lipoprotein